MKAQRQIRVKNERKPSQANIAKRYLDLQRLREAVREAEISCQMRRSDRGQRAPLQLGRHF